MLKLFGGRFLVKLPLWVAAICFFSTPLLWAQSTPDVVCLNGVRPDGALVITLEHEQQTNHIILQTHDADENSFMLISDGTRSARLALNHAINGRLDISLKSPLHGQTFVIYRDASSASDKTACITQVSLLDDKAPLRQSPKQTGDTLPLVDATWFSVPTDAAEGRFYFGTQGTWQWQGALRTASDEHLFYEGTYRVVQGHLQMRLGHSGAYVPVDVNLQHVDACSNTAQSFLQTFRQIHIQHTPLAQIDGTYNSQWIDGPLALWLITPDLGCF